MEERRGPGGTGDEFEESLVRGAQSLPRESVHDLQTRARRLLGRGKGSPATRSGEPRRADLDGNQRLLILDAWQRSGLPADQFAALVGVARHTLHAWKRRFDEEGPAGLSDKPRGWRGGSRLSEATKRAILMLKQAHPEWGSERISDVLYRSDGFQASAGAVTRVLKENGYESVAQPTTPHAPKVTRFERATPNQLWQTDLFTFLLKRENRRVWLVVFMDDHSRFITGYGLWASCGGALVREVLDAAILQYGLPEEVLTDNGPQYATWRGTSAFSKHLQRKGIKHLLAHPRRPQTLGKVERFWGSLWRECLVEAVFQHLGDARQRVGLFIDHYNFHRPHQGLDGLVPADRFFAAASEVRETLKARVSPDAARLAREGSGRKSFYLTGRVGDTGISLHSEGSRVVMVGSDGLREEVDLSAPGRRDATDDLPQPLVPTSTREVSDDDEDEATEADGLEESAGERDRAASGEPALGDAVGLAHAAADEPGAGYQSDTLLPLGGASVGRDDHGLGAAPAWSAVQPGAPAAVAAARVGAAEARTVALPDAVAHGAPYHGDPDIHGGQGSGEDAQDRSREESDSGAARSGDGGVG